MFREMRRKNQALSESEALEILDKGTSGVLALLGDEGYPYAVPMSYVHEGERLYFHCALTGHKLDAVRSCEKASFCVIGQDEIVPEKYTTCFKSVIAFGKMRILEEETEKRRTIELLAKKYAPEATIERQNEEIEGGWNRFCMLELAIEHMTGKEAIELLRKRS